MRQFQFVYILFFALLFFGGTVPKLPLQQYLNGAWQRTNNGITERWIFADGYSGYAAYSKDGKSFGHTLGGPFRTVADRLEISIEFNSLEPQTVNKKQTFTCVAEEDVLTTIHNGVREQWRRMDDAKAPLAGNWHITQRMQEGRLQKIHQTGTRKTIKLLSASAFQWIAIDPAVSGFYGTGGGDYIFSSGVYTEKITFFSRDSSRVGTSLSFAGKLENGEWHHSGKSSKGDYIYEVWSRTKTDQ